MRCYYVNLCIPWRHACVLILDFTGPAPLNTRWTVLCLDLSETLTQYLNRNYSYLKSIRLCANMYVKNIFTSDMEYEPSTYHTLLHFRYSKPDNWSFDLFHRRHFVRKGAETWRLDQWQVADASWSCFSSRKAPELARLLRIDSVSWTYMLHFLSSAFFITRFHVGLMRIFRFPSTGTTKPFDSAQFLAASDSSSDRAGSVLWTS